MADLHKEKYRVALLEGTPLDYKWGATYLDDDDRAEVQVAMGLIPAPVPEPVVEAPKKKPVPKKASKAK